MAQDLRRPQAAVAPDPQLTGNFLLTPIINFTGQPCIQHDCSCMRAC